MFHTLAHCISVVRPLVEDMDFVVRCKLSALYKRNGNPSPNEVSSGVPTLASIIDIPLARPPVAAAALPHTRCL